MRVSLVCNYCGNLAVVVSFFVIDVAALKIYRKMRNFKCRFYMMSLLALELISYNVCVWQHCFGVPARHLSVLCWQSVSEKFLILFNVSVLLPFMHFSDYSQKWRLFSCPPSAFFHFAAARFCSSWIPSIVCLTSSGAELMNPFIRRQRHSATRFITLGWKLLQRHAVLIGGRLLAQSYLPAMISGCNLRRLYFEYINLAFKHESFHAKARWQRKSLARPPQR